MLTNRTVCIRGCSTVNQMTNSCWGGLIADSFFSYIFVYLSFIYHLSTHMSFGVMSSPDVDHFKLQFISEHGFCQSFFSKWMFLSWWGWNRLSLPESVYLVGLTGQVKNAPHHPPQTTFSHEVESIGKNKPARTAGVFSLTTLQDFFFRVCFLENVNNLLVYLLLRLGNSHGFCLFSVFWRHTPDNLAPRLAEERQRFHWHYWGNDRPPEDLQNGEVTQVQLWWRR